MKKKTGSMVVKPAPKEVAYFSYKGYGLAVTIGDKSIDDVFAVAKSAFKKSIKEENGRSKRKNGKGKKVRSEEK